MSDSCEIDAKTPQKTMLIAAIIVEIDESTKNIHVDDHHDTWWNS